MVRFSKKIIFHLILFSFFLSSFFEKEIEFEFENEPKMAV